MRELYYLNDRLVVRFSGEIRDSNRMLRVSIFSVLLFISSRKNFRFKLELPIAKPMYLVNALCFWHIYSAHSVKGDSAVYCYLIWLI